MRSKTSTKWYPTAKQAALLQAAREGGFGRSITAMTLEAGVDRTCFYKWIRESPGFRKEWTEAPKRELIHHLPGVLQALVTKANSGDVMAIREYLELIDLKSDIVKVQSVGPKGEPVSPEVHVHIDLGLKDEDRQRGIFSLMRDMGLVPPSGHDGGNGNGA